MIGAVRAAHAVVSLVTAATFARALPYPLQASWDDGRFIIHNPDAHEVSLRAFLAIVTAPRFEAYHPLHLLSYWLDVPLFGASGLGLHAVNLGLWVIAANVLLAAFLRLGLTPIAASLATLACAVHPIQVEAVSWATGRKDVLALLFAAASLYKHLASRMFWDRSAWLARAFFVLAALSKTTVLPLPAVFLLMDTLLGRRSFRSALIMQLPSLCVSALLGSVVIFLWQGAEMLRPTASIALMPRMFATLLHQLGTAFWPSATSPMYSTQTPAISAPLAWCVSLLLLVTFWLAHRMRARRALVSMLGFLLLWLPVSNALPMYFPLQDRYLSLPLMALAFGFGAGLDALCVATRRSRGMLLGACIVALLALRSVQYQGAWQSEVHLWEHAAQTQPDAFYAHMQLGGVRQRAGDLYGAIVAYQALLRIDPTRKVAHAGLLQAVALRDEALRGIKPSRAENYAKAYYAALDDLNALRSLAQELLQRGYLRSFELPAARVLKLQPMPDEALERASIAHFAQGRASVGLFFLDRMRRPANDAQLRELANRARSTMKHAPRLWTGDAQAQR